MHRPVHPQFPLHYQEREREKEVSNLDQNLTKKYGLLTAIAMVVGVVIGSGIFFKTEAVLAKSNGNAMIGILAIAIVGIIMIICAYTFSILAGRYEKVSGLVDYAEASVGSGYAYYIGWFMATIYYPTITSVLVWLSARYTAQLFGVDVTAVGGPTFAIAAFYLVAIVALNALAPVISGKFQVSATFIKLIPLLLMAVVGIVRGVTNGTLIENFTAVGSSAAGSGNAAILLGACVAMAFSYEGWIVATTINAELHDARRNLPRALILGSLVVVSVYVLYYLGINGSISTGELMEAGSTQAFINVFGNLMGSLLVVFIIISCLGTANGLTLGCSRAIFSLATRNQGPKPALFGAVDKSTGIPHNSAFFSMLMIGFWLLYFYGGPLCGWFGPIAFDSSELPIVTLYGGYIPIFFLMMKNEKDLSPVKRYVFPALSIICCVFMVVAAFIGHGAKNVFWYLVVFAVFMIAGVLLRGKNRQAA